MKRREAKRRYKAKYPDKWRIAKSAQNARYRARQKSRNLSPPWNFENQGPRSRKSPQARVAYEGIYLGREYLSSAKKQPWGHLTKGSHRGKGMGAGYF
jgi:hypothetical protein